MQTFADRLKYLRKSHTATQKKIAEVAGITDRAFRKYESGEIEPTASVINSLADYFNVSTDYLLGRSDNPERQ